MEDYLLCMKAFRSHMNEVEDQAAKISVDEQMRITTVQTLEKDLDLAYSDIKRIKMETDQLVKAKGQICSHILEKKRTLSSLESDSSMLSQTLELVQQERNSLSAKLVEKSTYYTNTEEDINAKLHDQQMMSKNSQGTDETGGMTGTVNILMFDIFRAKIASELFSPHMVRLVIFCMWKDQDHLLTNRITDLDRKELCKWTVLCCLKLVNRKKEHMRVYNLPHKLFRQIPGLLDDRLMNLETKLHSAKSNLDLVKQTKLSLVSKNSKVKQSIELLKCRISDHMPELQGMNLKTLEEEHQALLSDRAGETEYILSLQLQFQKLKVKEQSL
ncbi:uncharacterized protein LOC127790907 [Diospyros lotus]|uniref:uncharacterized protein LOC127790907 n=1 Tax=Diospyros lotus TaxID=55363 RepID=UPI002259C7BB|nr:uncharacterized protein LOC127790907 [Diospyros lotus]